MYRTAFQVVTSVELKHRAGHFDHRTLVYPDYPAHPVTNSITGARQITSRYCRFALCSVCGRAFHALLQCRADERIQITIQHRLGVAGFDAGTQILDA